MQSKACIRPLAARQPQGICYSVFEQHAQFCHYRQAAEQEKDRTFISNRINNKENLIAGCYIYDFSIKHL